MNQPRPMLKTLSFDEIQAIDARVHDRVGWDFSRMKESFSATPWNFEDRLGTLLSPETVLLDQGTGGGERLLQTAPNLLRAVGIDLDPKMIEAAERNRAASKIPNVSFTCCDTRATPFDDASFDVVANRHSILAIEESARLLSSGGVFITQQVGGENASNLFACFGWDGAFSPEWDTPIDLDAFGAAGFELLERDDYRIDWWIHDVESLIFWLRSVPTPSPFDVARHWVGVNRAVEELGDERGIRTTEHRELLIARRV